MMMNPLDQMVDSTDDFATFAGLYFDRLREILSTFDSGQLRALASEFDSARTERSTIFVVGNGGSATTATSMANDLGFDVLKKSGVEETFRVFALTDNNASVTAIANDVGYEDVFVNQLRIHFRPGDRLLAISASGNSPNVVRAAEWVRARGGRVMSLLGFGGGRLLELSDIAVHARSEPGEYGPVEDAHLVVNHLLAHWFQVKLRGAT
jgi:D-sedoheptulose 7-phosphate isomerase